MSLKKIFIIFLSVALVGYAFFGRAFAYIGITPFYIDVFLFLLALTVLLNPRCLGLFRLPNNKILFLFMSWGLIRTIPFIKMFGIDALRDGVIWAWAVFALALGYILTRHDLFLKIVKWYDRWIFWFVLWVPFLILIRSILGDNVPSLPWGPGGDISLLRMKAGDAAVHLAGAMVFHLSVYPNLNFKKSRIIGIVFWIGWLTGLFWVIFTSRGAFLTVVIPLLLISLNKYIIKRIIRISLILIILLGILAITGLEINLGRGRSISFEQLIITVQSILGTTKELVGTINWRLNWWEEIINYTVFGKYFLGGKGFGINLATDDGFQVFRDESLRSPHNIHMNVLARMGVPGFFLWMLLIGGFGFALWLKYKKYNKLNNRFQSSLYIWVLYYGLASIINASFDVYHEGPMGGIWFWCMLGFAMALLIRDKSKKPFVERKLDEYSTSA